MVDSALEPAEREFLRALNELGVRYLIVGVTAASMQGARVATEDIDLWFEDVNDHRIGEAARSVGGSWFPGHFGMQPPAESGQHSEPPERSRCAARSRGRDGGSRRGRREQEVVRDSLRVSQLSRFFCGRGMLARRILRVD